MAHYADRVLETTTTTGTGNITLSGAVTGYRTFNAAIGTSTMTDYAIVAIDGSGVPTGEWEVGHGYLSGSTTLVRNTLLASSTGSAVSFAAGTKQVFINHAAEETMGKGHIFSYASNLILP